MVTTLEHHYTPEEIEKIQELRSRVAADLKTKFHNEDAFLVQWLRARNLNVDQAEEMLLKNLKWRKAKDLDNILTTDTIPEKYRNKIPFAYLGMEEETGSPVFLFLLGRWDFRTILEEDGFEAAMRYQLFFMEQTQQIMKAHAKKVGHPVTSFIELMDLEGYSIRQMGTKQCRDAMAEMQKMFDENYPEAMRMAIAINAPKVFAFVFNMMKPLIPKRTLEKLEILGPDVEKWKAVISKKIPMDLVPPHWGGTRPGNDEYCSDSDIWKFGPLGPKYFSNEDEDGFTKVKVKARDKLHIEFEIDEANTHLEWKFKTDAHDISFGIHKENHGEIIPVKRVDSHKNVQEGRHRCETTGTYKIVFDNTYSYTRAKTLYHRVDIILESALLEDVNVIKIEDADSEEDKAIVQPVED